MDRLYKGIHQFQASHFRREEEFFRRLSKGQQPEVLFITCADAQVDPNLVTQSKPGELFILRNVGNIIPPYTGGREKTSTAAALEFAVLVLKVSDIIVCGHSNCGAMAVLRNEGVLYRTMPHLSEWVRIADPVRRMMARHYRETPDDLKHRIMEKENVLFQLGNIETYPFVENALEAGALRLHGWYYDIATGQITAYNPDSDIFENVLTPDRID